ncbi:uncharacterized protein LOC105914561 [Setaria italica]|uniref:uncharacterized protein LOC105914561 n=1 Tax=Setaria italica TaxID=4555 RepID=UPI000647E2F2|nr:uncharacterized protein LOC105914561 [Setaria italica]
MRLKELRRVRERSSDDDEEKEYQIEHHSGKGLASNGDGTDGNDGDDGEDGDEEDDGNEEGDDEGMGFKRNWNKEIIAQFFATGYFGHVANERAMFWMTEGDTHHITYPGFASMFKFRDDDHTHVKLHDGGVFDTSNMHLMYPKNKRGEWGKSPRSPISPSPLEVEIPSVEEIIGEFMSSGYFDQYGSMFYPDMGGSSSTPPPFQPYTAGGFDAFV